MRKRTKASPSNRLLRINDEIMKVCAEVLRSQMKDPRLSAMVSVTKADTTRNLGYCKVYVSVLGDGKQKEDALSGLKSAASYIRGVLAKEINLRNTPELTFVLDDSLEYSAKMMKLINEADKGNEE